MKTTITKAQLAEATGAVKGVVLKDALSMFSRVRLDVVGPNISLTGSSGEVQVLYRFQGETADNGTATLPGGLFWKFAAAMPDGKVEIESAERGSTVRTTMNGGGVKFKLAADAEPFPLMAEPKENSAVADIGAETLREMLRKTSFAASTDATRAILCGVNVRLNGEKLEMTATDGRRLAHVEHEISRADKAGKAKRDFDITLPNKTVAVLRGLLDGEEDCVTVRSDGAMAVFTCDRWRITTKVVEGAYPFWEKVIPGKPMHEAKIGRVAFLEAMGRAALAAGEDNAVKVTLANTACTFEAKNELSAANAGIACCAIADDSKESFLFNPRFLKDALESIDDDDFLLGYGWGGAHGPVLLKCSIPWTAAVMPMHTK